MYMCEYNFEYTNMNINKCACKQYSYIKPKKWFVSRVHVCNQGSSFFVLLNNILGL